MLADGTEARRLSFESYCSRSITHLEIDLNLDLSEYVLVQELMNHNLSGKQLCVHTLSYEFAGVVEKTAFVQLSIVTN